MTKSRKSILPWMCCEKCQSTFTLKDLEIHETNCPPHESKWNHSYIRNGVLYSTLDCYSSQVQPQNISPQETDNMVFMAQSAMQLCNIAIGDPVVMVGVAGDKIVRKAWPTDDKTLTSISMTRRAMDSSKTEGLVQARKLSIDPQIARVITIEYTGKDQSPPKITPNLEIMMKNRHERMIFSIGNRITLSYYGKNLGFKIVAINNDEKSSTKISRNKNLVESFSDIKITEENINEETEIFYQAIYRTKWEFASTSRAKKLSNNVTKTTINDIGGYENLIADLRDVLDVGLGKWRKIEGLNVAKGILLYGTPGVGKSLIANAVLSDYSAKTFAINSHKLTTKISGDEESRLWKIFEEAKNNEPSVILIEDIDILCPRGSSTKPDNEKHVVQAMIVELLDEIRTTDANVVVLATTSRLDSVDNSLRRTGRLDKELEVCAPTPDMRKDILLKFLNKVRNRLTNDDVYYVASTTHGFVGSDILGLCSEAGVRAMKRHHDENVDSSVSNATSNVVGEIAIEIGDFMEALKIAKPSAMKEVMVEVPNVKWTEIGGQRSLKLKLKQAVEWPLRHPEAFTRLGICPPRGLLMFGPPGCSKTMIAKALATESKLNFLNIKGPELFSKWVGESEKAVRQVFRKARQVAPSIIFIDEIDALGSERGSSSNGNGGSNVQERVLAQLLTELDGVTALGNVTLVAATNRPDRIDKALLRPGRLDRIVYVPLPDAETRREIFAIKFSKMPHAKDVIIQDLVDLTEGYSGAEVQAICHEAAMKALEEDLDANIITKEHFKAALSIVTPRTPPSLVKMYEDYINNYK